ncbi:MAG TPA: RecX family transcriptional regulator, partial [Gaiellaceae bacterium]|nr:RecX family transcriptional regulator [Gaiellaceae bacterium]
LSGRIAALRYRQKPMPPDGDAGDEGALDRAVRALARSDHSEVRLRAKLARAGVSEAGQTEAIETLARAGYVDDARFARDRAARLAARGYGDDWIRADLEAQGVADELVDAALAALAPEHERALVHAAKLGGGVRAGRALGRRGFSEDALEAVVAEAIADDPSSGVG